MKAAQRLQKEHGLPVSSACDALDVPRASYYRGRKPRRDGSKPGPRPARSLSAGEREEVLEVLNSERFCDAAPRQVYATLLGEGTYLAHWRTMYRLLEDDALVRERRQAARKSIPAPRLVAEEPCQVWSWDITKLRGPKHVFYYLYVIIDIFSRYIVGWTLARRECKHIAHDLIEATCHKQGIEPGNLTLHADRGPSMRSATVSELLIRLGVERSHNRPRVSNDNPFSESAFKTVKYCPQFPDRFGSEEQAWDFCQRFFHTYNYHHHHSALALLTPATVHFDDVDEVLAQRDLVLAQAYAAHPERFVRGKPRAGRPPSRVAINPEPSQSTPSLSEAGPSPSASVAPTGLDRGRGRGDGSEPEVEGASSPSRIDKLSNSASHPQHRPEIPTLQQTH